MQRKSIIISIIVAAVIIIILAVGLSQRNHSVSSSEVIKIGGVFALTGDSSSYGEMEKRGAMLAVKEINAAGGVNGKQIEMISEDMRSTSEGSVSAVSKEINIDKVRYIVGPTWMDSYPGAQGIIKGKDVLLVLPSSSVTAVNTPINNPNTVSLWYRTDQMAEKLADGMVADGTKKIVVIQQNDPYYLDFADNLKKYADEKGITIVANEAINPGTYDFKTTILKYKTQGVDGIVFAMYDKKMLDNFLKNRMTIAPDIRIYSNSDAADYLNNPDYKDLLENMALVIPKPSDIGFVEAFKKEYGMDIPNSYGAITAYDAVYVIADVIKHGDADPITYVKSHEFKTKTYGPITFDEIGGVVSKRDYSELKRVVNGVLN